LPVDGTDEVKQTNEIGMAIPLLEDLEIAGKTVTADALLTQRDLARYLVERRDAHYLFTAKDNQPTLLADIACFSKTVANPISASRSPSSTGAWNHAQSGPRPDSTTT
jgi:hypothetical protein